MLKVEKKVGLSRLRPFGLHDSKRSITLTLTLTYVSKDYAKKAIYLSTKINSNYSILNDELIYKNHA